jgi:hypothetical protein
MPLPELTVGLVVRYEYIWARRAIGAGTADKDHPACVVATFRREGKAEEFVVYLPISHTQPGGDEEGFELSDHAKSVAGLDGGRQWVFVSECNIDAWPIDITQLPRRPGRFHYGHLPPAVFKAIRDRFAERYRARRVRQVGRQVP